MGAIITVLGVILGFFAVTFTVYFFNLDMKLVRKIYELLGKHYDTMKKDKKL